MSKFGLQNFPDMESSCKAVIPALDYYVQEHTKMKQNTNKGQNRNSSKTIQKTNKEINKKTKN